MTAFYISVLIVSLMALGGIALLIMSDENKLIGAVVVVPVIYSIYVVADRLFSMADNRLKSR